MISRMVSYTFALLSYSVGMFAIIGLMVFLLDICPHWSVNGDSTGFMPWIGNALLVLLFATHHSVMARPALKTWLARYFPRHVERSLYVLVSSAILILLMVAWQPIGGVVWSVEAISGQVALYSLYATGWAVVFTSTFLIDHFALFGLKQAFGHYRNEHPDALATRFVTPLLYRVVRHPLMTGMLILLWATPVMTVGHAYLATMLSIYIWVGTRYEERDLVREFGSVYQEYQQRVPGLMPGLRVPVRRDGPHEFENV